MKKYIIAIILSLLISGVYTYTAWQPTSAGYVAAANPLDSADVTAGSGASSTLGRLQLDYYQYTDAFDSNLNYLTGGDGIKSDGWILSHSSLLSICDKNITNAGKLTIAPTDAYSTGYSPGSLLTGSHPYIYREQFGNRDLDYNVKVTLANIIGNYDAAGLGYQFTDSQGITGVYFIFMYVNGASRTVYLNTAYNSNSTAVVLSDAAQDYIYFRIVRSGATVTGYYKKLVGDSWTAATSLSTNATVSDQIQFLSVTPWAGSHADARYTFESAMFDTLSTSAVSSTTLATDPLVVKPTAGAGNLLSMLVYTDNDPIGFSGGTLSLDAQYQTGCSGAWASMSGGDVTITSDGQAVDGGISSHVVTSGECYRGVFKQTSTTGAQRSANPTQLVLLYGNEEPETTTSTSTTSTSATTSECPNGGIYRF